MRDIVVDGAGRAWHQEGSWQEVRRVGLTATAAKPKKLRFFPSFKVVGELAEVDFSDRALRAETMFFRSSRQFAFERGGPITKAFLAAIPDLPADSNIIVDARYHKLDKGHYPCIPGFHLDFVRADEHDWSALPQPYKHYIMLVGQTSLTEFVAEPIELDPPTRAEGRLAELNEQIKALNPKVWQPRSGEIVEFTSHDWHRGVAAQGLESRFFIRASIVPMKPTNEVRTQSQVYIKTEESVW